MLIQGGGQSMIAVEAIAVEVIASCADPGGGVSVSCIHLNCHLSSLNIPTIFFKDIKHLIKLLKLI